MKSIRTLFAATLLITSSASAEILGVEQFDYPDAPISGLSGGTFWNWRNQVNPNVPGAPGRTAGTSDWDAVQGAPTVSAGGLTTQNNSVQREYNGPGEGLPITTDEGLGAISRFDNGTLSFQEGVVYYRITLRTPVIVTPDTSFSIGTMDFGQERVTFGKRSGGSNFMINQLGVGRTDSTIAIQPDTTYTIVAKLDFGNGTTGTASLFINPDFNSAEPTPQATRSFNSTLWSSAVKITSGGGPALKWDDLVVATTWDDLGTIVTTTADEDNGNLDPTAGGGEGISLREAVSYSPNGSLITFAPGLSGKTITLNAGQIFPSGAVTIDATALPDGLTVNGNNATRHFYVGMVESLTLRGLTLIRGYGRDGYGGSIANRGTLNLFRCTLTGNASPSSGGAIASTGPLRAEDCTFSENTSGTYGGGIGVFFSTAELTRCTLNGNTAEKGGALWYQVSGAATLSHCTISGNRSTGDFTTGGISAISGTLNLQFCTLSQNTGNGGGGGLYLQAPATVNVTNSIIAGNADPGGSNPDIFFYPDGAVLTASGTNLIGNNTSVEAQFPMSPLVGTAAAPVDPKLSPLGYFGGPVQTMHPLIGSPAIDAAGTTNPGGTDARGFPRFVDGDASGTEQFDIGAVEAGPLTTVAIASDLGGSTELRNCISAAAVIPGARIGFLPAAFPATITLGGTELTIPATPGLFIDASNLTAPVTISGNNASRVFNIPATATVAMHSVKIVNGRAPDGPENVAGGSGGGILNAGALSLFSSTIAANRAGNGGSGIVGTNGSDDNGGNGGNGSTGSSGGFGGGMFSNGPLTLTACTLSSNAAGNGGDGGQGGDGGRGTDAEENDPGQPANGGAGGRGGNGGNGGPGGMGGGIFSSGPLSIAACTFSSNIAGKGGEGGNSGLGGSGGNGINGGSSGSRGGDGSPGSDGSGGSGGGIRADGRLSLTASTLAGNVAGDGGGDGGGNKPGSGGGLSGSIVTLQNCLIVQNTQSGGAADDVNVNSITYVGANLLGTVTTGTATGPAPIINPNPLLAPLADNGGPTQTMALLPNSPAINAAIGSTRTKDQRGFPVAGVADIGAFEFSTKPTAPNGTTTATTGDQKTITLPASDEDGGPLSVTAIAPGGGITVNSINGLDVTFTAPSNITGNFALAYTVSDGTNSASGTITVTVTDNDPPQITFNFPSDIILPGPMSDFRKFITATDNTSVVTLSQNPPPGFVASAGTLELGITATDASGNSTTDTRILTARLDLPHTTYLAVDGANTPLAPGAGTNGLPADAKLTSFGLPAIDDDGNVAFVGKWASASGKGTGLFAGDKCLGIVGGLAPIAGAKYVRFTDPVVSGGKVATIATLAPTGKAKVPASVVLSNVNTTGALQVVAQVGGVATVDGAKFKAFKNVAVLGGHVGIFAQLANGTGTPQTTAASDLGLWITNPAPVLVLREGGLAGGKTIKTLVSFLPGAGSPGQGRGWLGSDTTPEVHALAFFTDKTQGVVLSNIDDGSPTVLSLAGATAAGAPAITGAAFASYGLPARNQSKTTAFAATMRVDATSGVTKADARGIFLNRAITGKFTPLARVGKPAGVNGANFSKFSDPVLSPDGSVAFLATLKGGTAKGPLAQTLWWKPSDDPLRLLAQCGTETVPGLPGARWSAFSSLAITDRGGRSDRGPIFAAKLAPGKGGVTKANASGVWACDFTGTLRPVFRAGDMINGKKLAEFTLLKTTVGNAGVTRSFNNTAQIVWLATFTDKTSAIIKTQVP